MMLSRADDSTPATEDATVKVLDLAGARWGAMYAGSPTYAINVVARASELLRAAKTADMFSDQQRQQGLQNFQLSRPSSGCCPKKLLMSLGPQLPTMTKRLKNPHPSIRKISGFSTLCQVNSHANFSLE
jgi:hypothetical protein